MKRIVFVFTLAVAAAGFLVPSLGRWNVEAQTAVSIATPAKSPASVAPTIVPSPSPTPEDIIKIDTELVNLNVRVIDRTSNRPVNDLQPKDFSIFEDGARQQIDFF